MEKNGTGTRIFATKNLKEKTDVLPFLQFYKYEQ